MKGYYVSRTRGMIHSPTVVEAWDGTPSTQLRCHLPPPRDVEGNVIQMTVFHPATSPERMKALKILDELEHDSKRPRITSWCRRCFTSNLEIVGVL